MAKIGPVPKAAAIVRMPPKATIEKILAFLTGASPNPDDPTGDSGNESRGPPGRPP